jgi:hypothetical protein
VINLFELMRQAQGGAALETMAKQAGVSTQQAQAAVEALMPAFALGLQRNASDPNGLAGLLGLLGSGRYNAFFQSPNNAFPPDASAWGEHALKQFFGGADVTRTIASQGAAMSGLAPQVIQQLLPFIAGVVVGGMVHAAATQGAAKPAAPQQPNPFEIFGASFLGRTPAPEPEKPAPAAQPLSNPFADMFGALFAGAKPASEIDLPDRDPAKAAEPPPRAEHAAETETAPAPEKSGGGEFLDRMMETSLDVQAQQIENWRRILGAFDGKSEKPRGS